MNLHITKTFKGKDGSEVKTFEAGKTYFIADQSLVDVILAQKWGVFDIFALPEAEVVPAPEEGSDSDDSEGGYGLSDREVHLLPVKQLKAIIEEEGFEIDTKSKKQADIAEAVVQALKTKYKGL